MVFAKNHKYVSLKSQIYKKTFAVYVT